MASFVALAEAGPLAGVSGCAGVASLTPGFWPLFWAFKVCTVVVSFSAGFFARIFEIVPNSALPSPFEKPPGAGITGAKPRCQLLCSDGISPKQGVSPS